MISEVDKKYINVIIGSGYNDPSSTFISQPPAIESTPIVETSPVLNYLNKSTGQQVDTIT